MVEEAGDPCEGGQHLKLCPFGAVYKALQRGEYLEVPCLEVSTDVHLRVGFHLGGNRGKLATVLPTAAFSFLDQHVEFRILGEDDGSANIRLNTINVMIGYFAFAKFVSNLAFGRT